MGLMLFWLCRSFLGALLPQLPKLLPCLASSSNSPDDAASRKITFLQMLARLLRLDAQFVLDPSQSSFASVLDSYCNFLTLR